MQQQQTITPHEMTKHEISKPWAKLQNALLIGGLYHFDVHRKQNKAIFCLKNPTLSRLPF